jgi:hypothetical protein
LLGIPTVLDRIIQQAIAQVLVEIFNPEFIGAFQDVQSSNELSATKYLKKEVSKV